MEALQTNGSVVSEYVGDGQGEEAEDVSQPVQHDVEYADPGVDDLLMEQGEESNENAKPLLFLYDCETTGFSMYHEHIIEIAAEVFNPPIPFSDTTGAFSSLVKTSRRIPKKGT